MQITNVELRGQTFVVTKRIGNSLNQHFVPLVAVRNYARFYSITEEQALDLILFEPLVTVVDAGPTIVETIDNCKARVQAGQGLAEAHQFILEEVEKHGEVPETDLDSPGGRSGSAGEPGAGEQHG